MTRWMQDVAWRRRCLRIAKFIKRDGDKCSICGGPLNTQIRDASHVFFVTLDHIVPKSHNGPDHPTNLRLAHRICNDARGDSIAPQSGPIVPCDRMPEGWWCPRGLGHVGPCFPLDTKPTGTPDI